jgi:hypothetical protein
MRGESKECHPERGRTPESKDPGAWSLYDITDEFHRAFSVKALFHIAGRRILGILRLGRSPSLRMTVTFVCPIWSILIKNVLEETAWS